MSPAELALDAAIALVSLAVVMSAGWTIQRQTGNSGWIDAVWTFGVGAPLMAAAIVGEALADSELARFKADPANRGAICDVGLRRQSRHPNYVCEFMVWLGVAIIAFEPGAASTWLALLAPAIMYCTLRYASGVPLLEEHMQRTRPHDFDAYAARTPVFFPNRR